MALHNRHAWPRYGAPSREHSHPFRCSFCRRPVRRDSPFCYCKRCPFIICNQCGRNLDSVDSEIHSLVAFATGKRLVIKPSHSISNQIIITRPSHYYGRSKRLCAPFTLGEATAGSEANQRASEASGQSERRAGCVFQWHA